MSISSSSSTNKYSVDTSGITDALDTIEKSKQQIQDLYEKQATTDEERSEQYDETKEKVASAFAEIPDTEEPLSDDNFNVIINALVTDDDTSDTLTTDASNHLRSIILATIGQDPDVDLETLSKVDAEQFQDILTQIIVDYAGEDGNLSVEEFEIFITEYAFNEAIEEDVTKEKDDINK
jgi:hypothetical protein